MMSDMGLGIIVSLKDAFTQNATRIQSSMESLDSSVGRASENMTRNLGLIEKGTMMVGAGLALLAVPATLVASTAATQKALGELASVGVKDFRAMEDAAESFTNQWAGANKAEFIGAAYDVKSALASLSDTAVGTFAAMAALTGKATKATTQEMVETFTTAYGIFKPLDKDMSDIQWAEMFSGALSQTVGVFKTTGPQMAEAIKNIGAIAAASNVPLQEQMAILGQLQTTMPGSEAGTLYKAFMMKATEAGNELGLSFVDAQGRLKGIVPILQEVKRGFPDLSQAAAQVKLKKAFGSDEAVRFVLQMSMGMDQLKGNIQSVEHAMKSGTAITLDMAEAMNMDVGAQYTVAKQQAQNLAEILGRTLLPVVTPVFKGVSSFILYLQGVAKSAPGATRVILALCAALGLALVVVGGATAAVGTLGIALPAVQAGIAAIGPMLAGAGAAVSASFWPVLAVIAGVVLAVILLRKAWETNFGGIRDVVMGASNNVSLICQGIRALFSSLSGGTGQMSAELAKKLDAAGLTGYVTTVFQVYFRVRQFLTGLWQAFSSSFGMIGKILEPVIRMVIGAFGELGSALLSVFGIFGMAATSVDSSSFKSVGQTLGKVLGVIVQVGAFVLKFVIYPLVFVIRTVALVVKSVVWLASAIVRGFIAAAPYVYKFSLPLRMIWEAFLLVGRVAYTVFRMITGQVSVVGGLKTIGGAILRFLGAPFEWVRDVAGAAWVFLHGLFVAFGRLLPVTAGSVVSLLHNLPIVRTLSSIFDSVRALLSGQLDFREAGKRILVSLGQGIWSAVSYPYDVLKSALGWLRRLLPFSNAAEGPLSNLTASGAALLRTLAQGMLSVATLPAQAMSYVLQRMMGGARWIWGGLRSIGSQVISTMSGALSSGAQNLAASAYQSGRAMMTTIAAGIRSAMSVPYDAAKSVLLRLRRLLPFSDAKEGPLSTLTRSGAAMLEAFSTGIGKASRLPAQALRQAFAITRSAVLPTAIAGTLALTPNIVGAVPRIASPVVAAQRTVETTEAPRYAERTQLLAATRGSAIAGSSATSSEPGVRTLLEAILSKLDEVADRPVEVTVTTNLDGRKIAQSVYKDMRDRKVRNYGSA